MVALLRSLVATNEVLNSAMHAPFLRLYTPQPVVLQDVFEGKGQKLTPLIIANRGQRDGPLQMIDPWTS
jgi:hypothetical protein